MTNEGQKVGERINTLPLEDLVDLHSQLTMAIYEREDSEGIEPGFWSEIQQRLQQIDDGTVREWKRRYMWDGPEGQDRKCGDDLDDDQLPAEYERIMSTDVMETLHWIRRMPMPRRIDTILKRERALEMLSKRAERVIGGLARAHGQQNKLIQVNAVTAILNSHENSGCDVTIFQVCCCSVLLGFNIYKCRESVS